MFQFNLKRWPSVSEALSEKPAISRLAEKSVIEANIDFYGQIAQKYDEYETCVSDPDLQKLIDQDLDRIATFLGGTGECIDCLDCGGGSGNLSLKMLRKGWSVTMVDVSPDMLALFESKARGERFAPRIVEASISDFLATTNKKYDVLTFNSVLHHLYAYLPVIANATQHVKQKGIFYSNFDPVVPKHPRLRFIFEAFDTALAKLTYDRSDFFAGFLRRIKKLYKRSDRLLKRPVIWAGDVAEYHALCGVNDVAVVECLRKNGFSIHEHSRWCSGRTSLAKFMNQRLRLMECFKIIAQRLSE